MYFKKRIKMDSNFFIERMLEYYNVNTLRELGDIIGVNQPVISGWKARNSIFSIKKKCIELGIFNEIFGDVNETQLVTNNRGQVAQYVTGGQNFGFPQKNKNDDVDDATYNLFLEAYLKAQKNDDIKGLRVHLMDY
jgi:hypothetical protein